MSITPCGGVYPHLLVAILLAAPSIGHAATPELLLDVPGNLWNINFVTDRDYSDGQSLPWMPLVVRDGTHGFELWRSDGTPAGTQLIKDIWPGASSGIFQGPFVPFDNLFLFPASDGSTTNGQFWRTDGTETGTFKLATDSTQHDIFDNIEVCNGVAYFIGRSGTIVGRLWRTDGSVAGTYMVSGTVNALPPMRCLGNELLFLRKEPVLLGFAGQIWKTDGTEAGMQMVAEIDASRSDDFQFPIALDASVVFKAGDDAIGREPYRTDGTTSGTYLLNDIWPGISSGTLELASIERWQNSVFFAATSSSQVGSELWKTDGTSQGTTIVRDLRAYPKNG